MKNLKVRIRWFLIIVTLCLFLAYLFGMFDSNETLVKPCIDMPSDMWRDCVDFYTERGWTYDEITKGIIVKGK